MSTTKDNADDGAKGGTIDNTKRVVIYPKDGGDLKEFLDEVQDEYDPYATEVKTNTTVTYMMEVDGVAQDITAEQYEAWSGCDVDDVEVWEEESTSTRTAQKHTTSWIAKVWIRDEIGESDIGEAHKRENSAYWRIERNSVLEIRARTKAVPMVKKLPEQSHNDIYEDEERKRNAIVLLFKPHDFPSKYESELNETIGQIAAMFQRRDDIEAVRPVGCFEVEKSEKVCPRV